MRPRRINGEMRDIATQAQAEGTSKKSVRARVARGLIPYRRLGGRIVFLTTEITAFYKTLPGVSLDEAIQNVAARQERP